MTNRQMTVLLFSTADWTAPYWTNKQHVADQLASRGHRILYLESPGIRAPNANARDISRIWGRLKRLWRPPQQVEKNLWVYSPVTIPFGHKRAWIGVVNGWLLRRTVQHWLKRHAQGTVVTWTYHPYMLEAIRGLPHGILVYHCVDDLSAIPGVDVDNFRAAEQRLLQRADAVFTTSPFLQALCSATAGDLCVYERNVADIGHFAQARMPASIPDDLIRIPSPRLGYVGVLSDYKLDFALIEVLAKARPDHQWIFIGEEPERQKSELVSRLQSLPNIHFLGYRAYSRLPDYLRGLDIAVLPNLTEGYMAGVFPMKLYEYMAAGRPILATPIDALAGLEQSVVIAENPDAWLTAINTILRKPPHPVALDDPGLAAFSWEARLDRMLQHPAFATLDR